jgi:hypothetical protein
MSDPDIIEAAARALCVHTTGGEKTWGYPLERGWYCGLAVAVLTAVKPLIRAAALEEAAQVAEERLLLSDFPRDMETTADIAAALRALKEQP